jgi:hypothetical protein
MRILLILFVIGYCLPAKAQNTRLNDPNRIGWWANFTTIKVNPKWGLHIEYQWRREDYVATWQQSLFRSGVNYQISPKAQVRVGYAWIETFNYGDYPINALGRDFTEHRAFQMVTLTDKPGLIDFSHRFMLEQRWIGRYSRPELTLEDEYVYLNRLRYMLRMQCPLKGKTIDDKEWYAAAYDEIFIGFGKNVNENVFDQNRVGLLIGYRFNKKWRIEGGYFNQIVQLPREITLPGSSTGQNVFQYNSGFIINTYWNVDWSKG